MDNRKTDIGLHYHQATKHSQWSVRTNLHFLDWSIHPVPFKIYRDLAAVPLPKSADESQEPLLSVLAEIRDAPTEESLSLTALHSILYHTGGITKERSYPGGRILFRAAACTGALYEIELYLACGDVESLQAGLYQYSPRDDCLYCLRRGDYRPFLAAAAADEPRLCEAELILLSTGTFWRNAWKYQARTYRHFGWDNGTILANLFTIGNALGYPSRLVLGYVDAEVNRLLGLDTDREVSLSLVSLGNTRRESGPRPEVVEPIDFAVEPLSASEVDYPLMREMHGATLLSSEEEVLRWRSAGAARGAPEIRGEKIRLDPLLGSALPSDNTETVIRRRGSSRRFSRETVAFQQFSTILFSAGRGISADFLASSGSLLNDWYLIVNAVDGLVPGAYAFHPQLDCIELLKEGEFRNAAGGLALGQALAADAAFAVFFLADLDSILDRFGNRGYRAVQLEAGILGGKLYLSAYAQGLGATGLTFFDDDVVDFFTPHARGKSAIFLVAVGKGLKKTA